MLFAVLEELRDAGEIPVVLNTSLNGRSEPIVASAEDAIAFFTRHPIDRMVIEDLVLDRRR